MLTRAHLDAVRLRPTGYDDGPQLQAALQQGGKVLAMGALTIKTPVVVTLPAKEPWLVCQPGAPITLDAALAGNTAITIKGTKTFPVDLAADIAAKANALTFATPLDASVLVGARMFLVSEEVPSGVGQRKGEWVRVKTIAGDRLSCTLYEPTRDSYATVAGVKPHVLLITAAAFHGEHLNFVGPADNTLDIRGLDLDTCFTPTLEGFSSQYCHTRGFGLFDCKGFELSQGVHLDNTRAGFSYGIIVGWGCEDGILEDQYGSNVRHVITHGGGGSRYGQPRRITSLGIKGSECLDSVWDCHPVGEDINVDGVSCSSSAQDGIVHQGGSGYIKNYQLHNCARHGILVQPWTTYQTEIIIGDGVIDTPAQHGILLTHVNGFPGAHRLAIGKAEISNALVGVYINDLDNLRAANVEIGPVEIFNCANEQMYIRHADKVVVDGPSAYAGPTNVGYAFYFLDCTDLSGHLGTVDCSGFQASSAVRLNQVFKCALTGGEIEHCQTGIFCDDTTQFPFASGFSFNDVVTPIREPTPVHGGRFDDNNGNNKNAVNVAIPGSLVPFINKTGRTVRYLPVGGTVTKTEIMNVQRTSRGTIAAGDVALTWEGTTNGINVGDVIVLPGCGAAGGDLFTVVDAIAGQVITIHDATTGAGNLIIVWTGKWYTLTGVTNGPVNNVQPLEAVRWTQTVAITTITEHFLR